MTTHYDLEDGNHHLKSNISSNHNNSNSNYHHNHRSGRWIRYNSFSNPCPICNGERRDCRSKDGIYFCRGENPSTEGFKPLGDSAIGFPMFRSLSDRLPQPQERDNYSNNYQKQSKYSPISDNDRATEFKKVFKQLGLSTPHRKAIEKRGLPPELIDKYQFKSVDSATELTNPVVSGMPLINGRKFNTKDSSILIPVWQGNEIVGAQLRPNDTSKGKYFWLKAGQASSHIESGGLPLACIIPDKINQVGVGLCESVGFKPSITSWKLDRVMIGASGGNFISDRRQFLSLLETHHPDKSIPVILYPDAGANENIHVFKQYDNLRRFLQHHGYTLKLAWWGQWEKETGLDIDDYLVSGGNDIKIIEWEEYTHKKRIAKSVYKKSRKYTPDIKINQRYLPSDIISKHLKPKSIVAVKSPMGTGKTEALKSVISELCKQCGLLMIGARNSLLLQSCERLNIYHLREDDASLFMLDDYSMIANCADSLPRWQDRHLENRVIVIDEISSFILHLLAGATCKRQRDLILAKLAHALKHAHAIILLDANIKDWEVDYIAKLSGFSDITKIRNDCKLKPWDIEFICGSINENDITENDIKLAANTKNYFRLISAIECNQKPIVVVSDSQRQLESIHHILDRSSGDSSRILRIDSTTVDRDDVKEFLRNPDDYICSANIKALLYSPTIDAGVDIKINKHFDTMYAFRFHIGTDQFMQMLGRVRDTDCKRYIFSNEYANASTNNFDSPFKQKVKDAYINRIYEDVISSISNHHKLKELLSELETVIKNGEDENFDAYCQAKAQANYENKNLRETLRDRLIEDGHNVKDAYLENDIAIRMKYKDARDEVIDLNANKMFNSPDINLEEADSLLSSWSASYEDALAARKAILSKRVLPGIKYSDLWCRELIRKIEFTDKELISRLTLRWHLLNPDKSQIIQQESWLRVMEKSNIYIPDWRSPRLVASKFIDIGLLTIINNPDREWTGDDEEIKAIVKKANHYSRRDYFPRKGKMSDIQYLNLILKRLGLKLYQARRNEKRFYKLTDLYETLQVGNEKRALSSQIMEILSQKLDSKADSAQTYIEQALEALPASLDNIHKLGEVAENCQAQSLDIRAGDWVDIDDGKTYCSVVEVQKEKVIVRWGTKGIFELNLGQILRVKRKVNDDWPIIWTK